MASSILGRNGSVDRSPDPISQGATPAMSDFLKSPHSSISAGSPKPGLMNGSSPANNLFSNIKENRQNSRAYNIFTSQPSYDASNASGAASEGNNSNSRLFQFNSTSSASSSTSPSSHYNGPSSSCGTSPEPSGQAGGASKEGSLEPINEKDGNYPAGTDSDIETSTNHILVNIAPEDNSILDTNMTSAPPMDDNSFGYINFESGQGKDPFAPMSWNDFPESNMALIGDGSFTGGFLSDISPSFEMQPMNWNDLTGSMRTGFTPAVEKSNPMESPEQMLATVNQETVPLGDTSKVIPCQKIWYAHIE
jgi:AP-1-like factor